MPSATRGWLFTPTLDLLLGCGGAYAVLFALMAATGTALSDAVPHLYMPFVALALSVPHYGATLLRVYADPEDRRRYAFFGTWTTGLLAAIFVAALYVPIVGSLLLTVYISWSPWHYSGQNYGLATMFLRRRGPELSSALADAPTRRTFRATFFLSYALSLVAFHAERRAVADAPIRPDGTVYEFLHLGIPAEAAAVLFPLLLAAYVVCLAFAGRSLLRRAPSLAALGPAGAIVASQALWFVVPTVAMRYGLFDAVFPLAAAHHAYAFLWIAIAHSVQYLWVTSYFAQKRGTPPGRFLGRALLGGAVVWVLPGLLFAPAVAGPVAYDAGLGLVIASIVNLHHFVLDGVIWKLRDGRIARILLRSESDGPKPRTRAWVAATLVLVGGVCLAAHVVGISAAAAFAAAEAHADLPAMRVAAARLRMVGRDSERLSRAIARARGVQAHDGASPGVLDAEAE